MIILGLDPGSRHTGYGLIERHGDRLRALEFGRFSSDPKCEMAERLAHLSDELGALVDRCQPRAAAMETPFHGLNARSLIVLAQARGALLATLAGRGLEIREYTPAEIKSAVSGNGRADKEQVQRMVRLILSLRERRLSSDAADALAAAICCAHRLRIDRLREVREPSAAPGR